MWKSESGRANVSLQKTSKQLPCKITKKGKKNAQIYETKILKTLDIKLIPKIWKTRGDNYDCYHCLQSTVYGEFLGQVTGRGNQGKARQTLWTEDRSVPESHTSRVYRTKYWKQLSKFIDVSLFLFRWVLINIWRLQRNYMRK